MSYLAAATAVQDSRFIKKHLTQASFVQSFSRHFERVVVVCVSGGGRGIRKGGS